MELNDGLLGPAILANGAPVGGTLPLQMSGADMGEMEEPEFGRRGVAQMLLRLAASADLSTADAVEAGREHGASAAARRGAAGTCAEALRAELAALGFDPEAVVDEHGATIAFTRCPFRELAESNPDLVCGLHRGLIEGFADRRGDARVLEFHDLADRSPCQVEIAQASR